MIEEALCGEGGIWLIGGVVLMLALVFFWQVVLMWRKTDKESSR